MEDGNLLNAEFLKNQLGVNPSKTILIMDDCEEFTNKVEENHSAEITRQQIEFLLNFFKTLIQQEDPLLQGQNMNPKIAILDIEYKIQFQEQELEVVNEFIEALKILEDLMSNFNSYNFILRTDDQKEGWEFDGLRYRSYTDDILTQITRKSGKEINFSIVLEMKRLVLFNEGLQVNLQQSKEFGISWRYIINFFDKISQYHGGNITCIVEDVKTGEGLRLQFVSVNEIPNFNSLSSFHSVILGSSIWKNNANPFKLDPNFTRRTFPCGIPRQNLLIMPITSLACGRQDSFDFKTGHVRSEQANDLGLMLQDLSDKVKGGIIVLFANQTLMGKITEKWVDQIQYDEPGDDWAGDLFKGRFCVIENSAPSHYESEEWANTMSQYHKSSTSGKGAIYLATIRSQRLESMQFTEEESRCVVIVGVSFSSVDTRCTIKKNRQNGFNEYYLPEAVNQVNRVVAKFLQKGDTKKLVVLADRRYKQQDYQEHFSTLIKDYIVQKGISTYRDEGKERIYEFLQSHEGLGQNLPKRIKPLPLANQVAAATNKRIIPPSVSVSNSAAQPYKRAADYLHSDSNVRISSSSGQSVKKDYPWYKR
ncbi:hypothetical protein FGO68_gene12447 [Halteria grandinella]|uniref:ATP-dependent helicase C-terminal domain-containing protein n=1 Tax=Halteria grandinella TaxID=5974 RepID=A0A8J8NYL7_HALGN|nr:hypothetical protein FGO68_gene12447 [Halteria grandinella]